MCKIENIVSEFCYFLSIYASNGTIIVKSNNHGQFVFINFAGFKNE